MSYRKAPILSVKLSSSIQFTFATVASVSAGYFLWKWLGAEDRSPKIRSQKRKRTVPGLVNVGNSCFMNALLQAFASCPSYVNWLKQFVDKTHGDNEHVYLARILLKVLKMLTGDTEVNDYCFDPSELLQDMGGRGWQISSQEQDAHEFYHAVMTTLIEEYQHYAAQRMRPLGLFEVEELLSRNPLHSTHTVQEETAKLQNPSFRGTLACVLQCQSCGYRNPVRYDGFDSLSLPLPSGVPWTTEITLMDCLRSFTVSELVQNVECGNCARLQNEETLKRLHAGKKPGASSDTSLGDINSKVNTVHTVTPETDADFNNDATSPNTLCDGLDGIISAENAEITHDTKQARPLHGVDGENFQEKISGQHSETKQISPEHKDQCVVSKNGQKIPKKRPFPKLVFTTQKQSFERYFQRRFCEKSFEKKIPYENSVLIPVRRLFQRRISFGKLPQCLCFHLQRLVWVHGTPIKKMNFVNFPEFLDIGSLTEISRVSGRKDKTCGNWFETDIKNLSPINMQKLLLLRRERRAEGDSPFVTSPCSQGGSRRMQSQRPGFVSSHNALYRLMSVIVHVGDWSFSGHFLAYRRSPDATDEKSDWVVTSDTLVRRATRKEVLSCPAYMLFYEKVTPWQPTRESDRDSLQTQT